MDKIILGLLMLRGMTIYEIKNIFSSKLANMCSSSTGSIHSAIEKLLKQEAVDCKEEGRKRVYYITAKGRALFTEFISTPMNHEKAKNIEESKFFFLGMVEPEKVDGLLTEYIESLKQERNVVTTLLTVCSDNKEQILKESEDTILTNQYNLEGIKKLAGHEAERKKETKGSAVTQKSRSMDDMIKDIYTYQIEILQHCVDSLTFEISWFEALRKRRAK